MYDRISQLKHVISAVCERTGYTEEQVKAYYTFFLKRFKEVSEREEVLNFEIANGMGVFSFVFNYGGKWIEDSEKFSQSIRRYARKISKIKSLELKERMRHYRKRNINRPMMVDRLNLQELEEQQNKFYAKKRGINK